MKPRALWITAAIIALAGAGALVASRRSSDQTVAVEAGPVRERLIARGVVEPKNGRVDIRAQVTGRVTALRAREGDRVAAGDLLAVITPDKALPPEEADLGRLIAVSAGTVLAKRVDLGDVITAAAFASPPLFEIADLSQTELRIEIEEADATKVAVAQRVSVSAANAHEKIGSGRIARLSEQLERRSIGADDARARADGWVRVAWFEWDEGARPPLVVGQRFDATIELAARTVDARLPRAAIRVRDGDAIVLIPGAWSPSERRVRLGAADEEFVEVSGVASGTRVLAPAPR
jgi:multidrug efflux pump subunit AcrA (membrane-fusion protein)